MPETKRTRTPNLGAPLMIYVQSNAGRILTIDELIQNHPLYATITRAQISSAMNNMVSRELIPGLVAGKARGTWVFNPTSKAAANTNGREFVTALIDVLPAEQPGTFIGVDKENARVYRMERIA